MKTPARTPGLGFVGNARLGTVVPRGSHFIGQKEPQYGLPQSDSPLEAYSRAADVQSGLIVAHLAQDIPNSQTPSKTLLWASARLADNYDGSTLPTLPTGYGYAIMDEVGSSITSPWSALAYGDISPVVSSRGAGAFQALRAFVDLPVASGVEKDGGTTRPEGLMPPSKSILYIVFSKEIRSQLQVDSSGVHGLYLSSNCPERLVATKAWVNSRIKNVLLVELSRQVYSQFDETITVALDASFADENNIILAPTVLPVFFRSYKFQYIIVRNTSGSDLSVGQKVLVSRTDWEQDGTNDWKSSHQVFCVTVSGGGGSSGVSLAICAMIGGNSYGTESSRPYSLPLPLDPDLPTEFPEVDDWTKYDLPASWSPGDSIPAKMPDGVCYMKVSRPSTIGGAVWWGDLPGDPTEPWDSPMPDVMSARASAPYNTIRLPLGQAATLVSSKGIAVITTLVEKTKLQVLKATVSGKVLTLTLNRALKPVLETVTVIVPYGLLRRKVGSTYYVNSRFQEQVVFKSAALTAILGLNRNAVQVFQAGDLVVVDKKAITIQDTKGNSRVVYDILHSATPGVRPHTHSLVNTPPIYGVSNVL